MKEIALKATKEITHFQIDGEEGRRLVFTFSSTDDAVAYTRILFVDEWSVGRQVELTIEETTQLRAVLSADNEVRHKKGSRLEFSDGELCFSVCDANRGDPYRDGFEFNLEAEYDGYPIFAESSECRDLANVISSVLAANYACGLAR